jgi:hypothetical protein
MAIKDKNRLALYKTWHAMISRCHNPDDQSYKWYGYRGISVCRRWRSSFDAFVTDVGNRPTGMQLDRRENDGNYEPDNCRWATISEQQSNKRKWAFRKTHCDHGHELTPENSAYFTEGSRTRRRCKICASISSHALYLKKHGALKQPKKTALHNMHGGA